MKFNKIIIAAGLVYFSSSCSEDFLDTKPMTSKTDGSYYTSPAEAQEALVGCYDGLQMNYGEGTALPVAADVLSDLCFGGTGATDADDYKMLDEFDKDVAPSYMNMYLQGWVNMYTTIYRCNMLLTRLDQVEWGKTPELSKVIEAEARFIRAFTYFDLARMFGGVPLLTEPSNENLPQSEPDVIYTLIAEDLLFAVQNLSANSYSKISATDFGHATKWSAESLLARVFLYYTGYYGKDNLVGLVTKADALAMVEDVIANSGHGLVPNYNDLWPAAARSQAVKDGKTLEENTYAGETNNEIVFAIKHTYTSPFDGNRWLIMNGIRLQPWALYGYDYGWGCNTVLPEVYSTWDANDTRRDASIMAIVEEGIGFTQINQAKEYTGYYTKKYVPLCDASGASTAVLAGAESNQTGQYQDYFVIRYSDVLLMAAELGSSDALSYVNQVRVRANAVPVATVTKDIIFEERRLEFAFEGLRYWDLLRYDHTLAYAAQKVSFRGTVLNGDVPTEKVIDGSKLVLTKGLFQIPYDQITLSNGVLIQNEGW